MKTISISKISFLALCFMGSAAVHSQSGYVGASDLDPAGKQINEFHPVGTVGSVNAKAVAFLNTTFADATNVKWVTMGKNLPYVYFVTPGKTHRGAFDKKGNLMYTLSYYHEEQLPSDVLSQVKNTYYGKSIFSVTEVNKDEKTAYLIILEDKTSWLHIKIIGEEIIVEKVFMKA